VDKARADLEAIGVGLRVAQERAPVGVTIRRFRDGDFEAMVGPMARSAEADGEQATFDAVRLATSLRVVGLRPEANLLLAEADGVVVGWVRAGDMGVAPDVGRVLAHRGCVDPAWRRRGIGGALVAGARALLVEVVRLRPAADPGDAFYETWCTVGSAGTLAMLGRDGYRVGSYGIGMVRRTLLDLPSGELPAGIECRPVRTGDGLTILRAMDEAMQDQHGWPPLDDDGLDGMLSHPLWGQTDIWQVAWEGDTVVAGVLGYIDRPENEAFGRRRGYTEGIFTVRPWRRRGIAAALIGRNLRLLRDLGMTEAALGVDTDNPTGALRLYQRVGFEEESRFCQMIRPVEVAGSGG
jgi:mycothiol synthase